MYCRFCSDLLEEDDSRCDNRICKYLNNKIKEHGILQFYLICFNSFEKYQNLIEDLKNNKK